MISKHKFYKYNYKYNESWFENLGQLISDIIISTGFKICIIEDNSRFGLIIYGKLGNEDAVLKLLLPNEKSYREICFFENNSYSFMNTILLVNKSKFFYISKSLNKFLNTDVFDNRLSIMLNIFEKVYSERNILNSSIFSNYFDDLMKSFNNQKIQSHCRLKQLFIYAYKIYDEVFINEHNFLLHGDLRLDNILKDNDEIIAIDPIGIYAPIEFEFTRFIEDEIFNCENIYDFENKLCSILFALVQLKYDYSKLLSATFIDSVYRTSLTVLMNDSTDNVNKGIKNGEWLIEIICKNKLYFIEELS